jgi:hypothetical protein
MRIKGKEKRLELLINSTILVILLTVLCTQVFSVDFLLPGVSLASISFEEGAMVRYLTISQTFGVRDSSLVELEVLDRSEGEMVLLINNSSYPPLPRETVSVKIVMREEITKMTSPSEFRNYISAVYVSQGGGDFQEATEEEIDDFDLDGLFIESSEEIEEFSPDSGKIVTPAGKFDCQISEYKSSSTRKINLGGVEGYKKKVGFSKYWKSDKVPFWGVVRSRVEKKSTTFISTGSPFYEPESKVVLTESILIGFR